MSKIKWLLAAPPYFSQVPSAILRCPDQLVRRGADGARQAKAAKQNGGS